MYKKIISILLIVAVCSFISACNDNDSTSHKSSKKATSNSEETVNDGIKNSATLTKIDVEGVVKPENFNLHGSYYTSGTEDLYIPFEYNGKSGFCNQNGNPVIENLNYFEGNSGFNFSENTTICRSKVYQGGINYDCLIDKKGKKIIDLNCETFSDSTNGERIVTFYDENGISIGKIDKNHHLEKINIPIRLGSTHFTTCYNGKGFQGAVFDCSDNNTNYLKLFGTDGKEITRYNFSKYKDGIEQVFGFNYSLYHSVKAIFPQNGYVNIMNDNGQWGLMDLNTKKTVVECKYDYVGGYSDGVVPVCYYGTWGAVDKSGKEIIPCKSYKYIGNFIKGRAIAINENNKYCIIDKKGNIVSELDIDDSEFFCTEFTESTGIACLYKYEKAYIINRDGDILLEGNYAYTSSGPGMFLYMNDKYLVFNDDSKSASVYKIN